MKKFKFLLPLMLLSALTAFAGYDDVEDFGGPSHEWTPCDSHCDWDSLTNHS